MQDDIRQSEKGGNTAYLNLGIWYEEPTGHIHMTLPNSGWFHTTVNNEVGSKRYHPNLVLETRACFESSWRSAP